MGVAVRCGEPYLYKVVVDTLADGLIGRRFLSSQIETLVMAVAAWFVLAILLNLISAQASYLTWEIGNLSSQRVHIAGYRRLLKLDYAAHLKRHSSKHAKIVDDADVSTWEMTNWWLSRFASAGLGFFGMLFIAFSVSWPMTLIAVSIIPPGIWYIIRYVKRCENEQRRVNHLWEKKHEHLSDQITNISTYKLNPHENLFVARQWQYSRRAYLAQLALNRRWRTVAMVNPDAFVRFLVLSAGIFFVRDGTVTLGTLFMFMGLLNEILTPLHVLEDILPQYSRRAQHIERYLNLLEQSDSVVEPVSPVAVSAVKGEVVFDRVSFWHSDLSRRNFTIRDISFVLKPGETAALVGHSGSGKTTIMTLLNRLVDPTKGKILIDGVDLRLFKSEGIKKYIGTVLQENAMYNETVQENIAYGNPLASRQQIEAAARRAYAHEFIERLPKKYDTIIGERGVRLSGGEKQRIAIARAILKNPTIVVLDEPTSALDSLTEAEVQRGLNELAHGRTTLIIAHRLSTVRHANVIIVLENGKIIGQGSHNQLVKSCETYGRMVELQTHGFLADQ